MPQEFEKKMNHAFDVLTGKKKELVLVTYLTEGKIKKPIIYTAKDLPPNISFVGFSSNEKPQKHIVSFKNDIDVQRLIYDLKKKFNGAYSIIMQKASGKIFIARPVGRRMPAFRGFIREVSDKKDFLELASIDGNIITTEGHMPRHLLPILKIVKTRKAEREM